MRVQLHQAFVLHRRPYSETSLLAELFSSQHGRMGVIAKGARRGKSGLRPVLQLYQPLQVAWTGRGELPTLVTAEHDGPLYLQHGEELLHGFYINELILRLVHRHESLPGLYRVYRDTLSRLCERGREEAVLRIFEKRMLEELGYGLLLDHEATSGQPIDADAHYDYEVEYGPVPGGRDAARISGRTLLALANESLPDKTALREAKRLMRRVLAHHLGDRPLASRQLFGELMKESGRT